MEVYSVCIFGKMTPPIRVTPEESPIRHEIHEGMMNVIALNVPCGVNHSGISV